MKIAIDMDNTIIDELGSTLRPGIIQFLDYLSEQGYDVLIDDDPKEIEFTKKNKRTGILVETYRKGKQMRADELDEIVRKYEM